MKPIQAFIAGVVVGAVIGVVITAAMAITTLISLTEPLT